MPNWISAACCSWWQLIWWLICNYTKVAWCDGGSELEVVPDLSALSLIQLPPSQHFTSTIWVHILNLDGNIIHILVSHRNHVCIRFNCQEMAAVCVGPTWCDNWYVAMLQLWQCDTHTWQLWHHDTYMTLWQQAPGQWSYLHMTGRSIWLRQS